jgi:threonine/homoserine/homoserine lactone efflux protein
MRHAARHGARGGLVAVAGVLVGGTVQLAVFALGLAPLLARSALLLDVVRWLGAGYLLWLGLGALRSAWRGGGMNLPGAADGAPTGGALPWRAIARQGLITNALNPKITMFYLAFLPQFIGPGDDVVARSALLIGIHYAIGGLWLAGVALAVSRVGHWLRRPVVARGVDGAVGVLLTAFGWRLLVSER